MDSKSTSTTLIRSEGNVLKTSSGLGVSIREGGKGMKAPAPQINNPKVVPPSATKG